MLADQCQLVKYSIDTKKITPLRTLHKNGKKLIALKSSVDLYGRINFPQRIAPKPLCESCVTYYNFLALVRQNRPLCFDSKMTHMIAQSLECQIDEAFVQASRHDVDSLVGGILSH